MIVRPPYGLHQKMCTRKEKRASPGKIKQTKVNNNSNNIMAHVQKQLTNIKEKTALRCLNKTKKVVSIICMYNVYIYIYV